MDCSSPKSARILQIGSFVIGLAHRGMRPRLFTFKPYGFGFQSLCRRAIRHLRVKHGRNAAKPVLFSDNQCLASPPVSIARQSNQPRLVYSTVRPLRAPLTMSAKILKAITCLMLSFILTSCSQQDVLVGKWQSKSRSATLEFLPDGIARFHAPQRSFDGKVSFDGKDRMMIGHYGFFRFKVLSDSELSWAEPNSQPDIYERVKQ